MAESLFARQAREDELARNRAEAQAKLDELRKRATPPGGKPIYRLRAARPGVPAQLVQVGKTPIDAEGAPVREWEAKRRADRISTDLQSQDEATAKKYDSANAENTLRSVFDAYDAANRQEPGTSFAAYQQTLGSSPGAEGSIKTVPIVTKVGDYVRTFAPGMWQKWNDALRTTTTAKIAEAGVTPQGSEILGLGGLPKVNTLSAGDASKSIFPVDPELARRAASGQDVFVGQGEDVARLAGPGHPATASTPSSEFFSSRGGPTGDGAPASPGSPGISRDERLGMLGIQGDNQGGAGISREQRMGMLNAPPQEKGAIEHLSELAHKFGKHIFDLERGRRELEASKKAEQEAFSGQHRWRIPDAMTRSYKLGPSYEDLGIGGPTAEAGAAATKALGEFGAQKYKLGPSEAEMGVGGPTAEAGAAAVGALSAGAMEFGSKIADALKSGVGKMLEPSVRQSLASRSAQAWDLASRMRSQGYSVSDIYNRLLEDFPDLHDLPNVG